MIETSEVRSWAKEQGIPVPSRGPVPDNVVDQYLASQGDLIGSGGPDAIPVDAPELDYEQPVDRPAPGEVAPKVKKPGVLSRLKPSGVSGKRVSTAPILGTAWSGVAAALVMSGTDVPVGQAMMFQAPLAGPLLDDAINGTIVDKAVQPFAKMGDRGGKAGLVLAFPLIVALVERRPELYPVLKPVATQCMTQMLLAAGPAMKQAKKEQEKAMKDAAEALTAFKESLGVDPDADFDVADLFDSIFSQPGAPDGTD